MKNINLIMAGLIAYLLVMVPVSVLAEPDFRVALESFPEWAQEGKAYTFQALVTNFGTAGWMKVEGGIYTKSILKDWGFPLAIGYDIANCNEFEKNVDTGEVYLDAGESTISHFTIIAPDVKKGSSDFGAHSFGLLVTAFQNCYSTGLPTGVTDQDAKELHIEIDDVTPFYEKSCTDGIKNQDESDTDCGGSHCKSCRVGYNCNIKDDCLTDYCQGTCQEVPDIDGDGKRDYDKTGASTPLEIQLNEFIATIVPYVLWIGVAIILILIMPNLLPSIINALKAILAIIRGLVRV